MLPQLESPRAQHTRHTLTALPLGAMVPPPPNNTTETLVLYALRPSYGLQVEERRAADLASCDRAPLSNCPLLLSRERGQQQQIFTEPDDPLGGALVDEAKPGECEWSTRVSKGAGFKTKRDKNVLARVLCAWCCRIGSPEHDALSPTCPAAQNITVVNNQSRQVKEPKTHVSELCISRQGGLLVGPLVKHASQQLQIDVRRIKQLVCIPVYT